MSYCEECGQTVCACDCGQDPSLGEVTRSLASIRVYLDGASYGCLAREARRLARICDKMQAARWAEPKKQSAK
jgi:hypothetical protein